MKAKEQKKAIYQAPAIDMIELHTQSLMGHLSGERFRTTYNVEEEADEEAY